MRTKNVHTHRADQQQKLIHICTCISSAHAIIMMVLFISEQCRIEFVKNHQLSYGFSVFYWANNLTKFTKLNGFTAI